MGRYWGVSPTRELTSAPDLRIIVSEADSVILDTHLGDKGEELFSMKISLNGARKLDVNIIQISTGLPIAEGSISFIVDIKQDILNLQVA